jgi:penicillin-binding protein 2
MPTKTVSRSRLLFFSAVLFGLFVLLLTRLMDVQLVNGQVYLKKAEGNRFFTLAVPAERGVFLDRYGEPLVWNTAKYFKIDHPESLFEKRTALPRDEALSLLASTASATVISDTDRHYRYPFSTAQALGYVGGITADDLQLDKTLHLEQQIGKAGLEKVYERELRGQDGQEVFEINALGQKQRVVEQIAPVPGQDMKTTLDPYLSEVARQALADRKGAVIITDAQSGSVLAFMSSPSFDPNLLSHTYPEPEKETERKTQVQALFSDPNNLFFNRAIAGAYPPGSVFKTVTALASLEAEKMSKTTQIIDDGTLKIGTYEFGNWYYSEYGRVEGAINLAQALTRSNDIYFYKAAEAVGPDGIAAMARSFGMGQKTGLELSGESPGLVPDPAWKLDIKNEKWYLGDTYHYGIGQGDMLVTPIQIAQLTQALANYGTLCTVHLTNPNQKNCRDVGVKSENLDAVLEGMVGACSPRGTGFPFFSYNEKMLASHPGLPIEQQIDQGVVACKTGTAEFGLGDGRGYKKTHGWFTAFVGLPDLAKGGEASATPSAQLVASSAASLKELQVTTGDLRELWQEWHAQVQQKGFPRRITMTILVESDEQNLYREGSKDAAPVAKKILDWMIQ